jgi:hypothetical protein
MKKKVFFWNFKHYAPRTKMRAGPHRIVVWHTADAKDYGDG